jgi:muramoyltetrapeptide carboxypeptidase
MAGLIRPVALKPGDVVRLVAPSGPVFSDALMDGVKLLSGRYRVRHDPSILFAAKGYLAGPDEQRRKSLIEAFSDDEARAIFMARGGYGLLRIVADIDPELLIRHPKPVVGFSDGTVLLALAARVGLAAIHGPVATQLGRLPSEDWAALTTLLESPEPQPLLGELEVLHPGRAEGRLLGGNLEVFSRLIGTPILPDLDGAILFLEEVGERPYRLDRLLTHLELAGVFARVAAVVMGDLVECEEPADSRLTVPPPGEVVRERLGRLHIPVVLGGHFGHGERNRPLPYGVLARLDTSTRSLVALEGVVS